MYACFMSAQITTSGGLIQLRGVQLFVRQLGRGPQNLVIVHGGPDWDHSYFLPYLESLSEQMRLTLFDLRGCGRSQRFGKPNLYHLTHAVEDLKQLLDALGLAKVTLLGFSYGGQVAMRFLHLYPAYVERLVLASTTAYSDYQEDLDGWAEYRERYNTEIQGEVAHIFSSPDLSDEARTVRLAHVTLPLDVYDLEKLGEARGVLDRIRFSGEWMGAWRAGTLRDANAPNYEKVLQKADLPTLILHGENDMRFPSSVAVRLKERLTDAKLNLIDGVGHLAHIEQTAAWNGAVLSFVLAQHDKGDP